MTVIPLVNEITEFDENDKITENQNNLDTTHLRLPFIENQGQIPSEYKYYAKTFAGTVYVTDSNLTYYSIKNENDISQALVIKEKFLGNSLNPHGKEKSESVVSYFKGPQDNWKTGIPTYNYVSLGQIWNNVDVDLKAHGNNMEKIFTIHPGGDPSDIQMSFDGISSIGISGHELKIDTDLGDVFLSKPIGYQIIDGKKHDIPVYYDVLDSTTYGFSVLSYDPRFDLVIDPLIASTFVGGSGSDTGYGIARDSAGNVYITGYTVDSTTDYPITTGAYDTTQNGNKDVFVSKFNSALTSLSASTFIGGGNNDEGWAITLDSSGNVYITGYTNDATTDYPITAGAYDTTHNGLDDVFVSKFNSALTSLFNSTFIGGSGNDYGEGITLDSSGNVYITGQTASSGYPTTTGAYDTTSNGGASDVFVSKFNSALTSLFNSTYIGGSGNDYGYGIARDSSGNVYITGYTTSSGYPTTTGAYDTTQNGGDDVFVSKFNSALTSLNSTFIGGSGNDQGYGITLDSSGNVYITGYTADDTTDYPTTTGAYDTTQNGNKDVFVSKFNSALTSLSASTFIGGGNNDEGWAITLDSSGNVYITGYTNDATTDYPITAGAYDTTHNGLDDVFVSKFNSALTSLFNSTFIGGSGNDYGEGITLDSSGNVYITGQTASSGYPTTTGAYDTTSNGGASDVFVSKFNSALTSLFNSTFIGGSGNDFGEGITLDSSGNVYIIGQTADDTTDYPTTTGAYDTTHNGSNDAFVSNLDCKLLAAGSACITSTTVTAGVSVTQTLSTGGTLEVTLPSASKVSFTLPSGISGNVTVVTTNSGSSDASISFLGTVVDFSTASCSGNCIVAFNFTQAQLTSSGFASSAIKVFRDSSGDGSFQTSEALTTTISTFSAGFTATASTPSTSKFAIGGVAGSVTANAAAGIGAAGNFLGLLRDNCDESGFGNGESLRIYEISYDKCNANQITILADTTCGPMNIRVEKESSMNLAGMPSDQPYLYNETRMIVLSSPITSDVMDFSIIAKDKRDEFYEKIYADQCSATKQYTFTTGYTSMQSNVGSLLLPEWIKNNAKWWADDSIDDNTFVNGIQYLVKNDIITVEKNTPIENTDDISDGIPEWIKNNAKWWSNGEIDDDTFVNGIQYLVNNGVIKVN